MMIEQHISVPRSARYYVLGDVANADDVWIVLHGYAQLARYFARPFQALVDDRTAVIAPEALNRYYFESAPGVHARDARVAATWMTKEDREHEIGDYVAYLDRLAATAPPAARLTVLGFSQGAQTASRWAAFGGTRIDRLVLWGAAPAHDVELTPDVFNRAQLVIAAGDADPQMTAHRMAAERDRLDAARLDARWFGYRGGHRVDEDAVRELRSFL